MVGAKINTLSTTPLYTAADFFMLRSPLLGADTFVRLSATADMLNTTQGMEAHIAATFEQVKQQSYSILREYAQQASIEQAIIVASTAISEGLVRIQRGETRGRRVERAYAGLLRYLVRMSTRPTPFGLFAGVAIGTLAEQTDLQLATPIVLRTRTRPDMSWLLSLIKKVENEEVLLPLLHVVANRTTYFTGGRVIIPYADIYGNNDGRSINLRATPVVRHVLEKAHQPLPFTELQKSIVETFPQATELQAASLLLQLWENHFLMSDLRPPLTSSNPASYVLERLSILPPAKQVYTILNTVLKSAVDIDCAQNEDALAHIRYMVDKQAELIPTGQQQAFQVDTALHLDAYQVSSEVGKAAAQATEILLRVGRYPRGALYMQDYYAAFVERYGMNAEVPLLELLSPENGIGAPATYTEPAPEYHWSPKQRLPDVEPRDRILMSMLAEVLRDRALEIELSDRLLEDLTQWKIQKENPAPLSVEIYLQIQAESREALDQGNWRAIVGPNPLAYGGRTFCRFFDILSQDLLDRLQAYIQKEESLLPDVIFAELSYLPTLGRSANVAIRPAVRAYEIVVNTAPSVAPAQVITLNDLVVGTTHTRLYVRSLRLGKEVKAVQSHMLNAMKAPNICRFLLDVALMGQPALSSFDWGAASTTPFLPRIVRQKMVLSPAQWNLTPAMITPDGTGDDDMRWFNGLQQWRARWQVPRYVYFTEFDNRLLLDLEHPLFIAELRDELKKVGAHGIVKLQEMLPDLSQLWLRDREQVPYIAELVVPLIANQAMLIHNEVEKHAHEHQQFSLSIPSRQRIITQHERRQSPGGAWTYLNLYASKKYHAEIIAGPLREIVQQLRQNHLIDRWFFIRYADPEHHLRVRFHVAQEQQKDMLLLRALAWSQSLIKHNLINHMNVEAYDREVERYGGPQTIDFMEHIFCANSEVIAELIAAHSTHALMLDLLAIGTLSLDLLFTSWGLNFEQRRRYTQMHTEKYAFTDAFRPLRKQYCELLAPGNVEPDLAQQQQRELILNVHRQYESVIPPIVEHIHALAAEGAVWQTEDALLRSLAHMHCNRLFGINPEREKLSYAFWNHTLQSIQRRSAVKEK